MKQILQHRLARTMAAVGVTIIVCAYIAGDTYPVAVAIIAGIYAVTLVFAVISIRKDLKHEQ